jgi:hypothetical protein
MINRKKKAFRKIRDAAHLSYSYFQCELTFYKKEDGEFKKIRIGIAPAPCCEVMSESVILKRIIESQNVPKECPVTPVSVRMRMLCVCVCVCVCVRAREGSGRIT